MSPSPREPLRYTAFEPKILAASWGAVGFMSLLGRFRLSDLLLASARTAAINGDSAEVAALLDLGTVTSVIEPWSVTAWSPCRREPETMETS